MSMSPARIRNPTFLLIAGFVVALLGGVLVVVLLSRPTSLGLPGETSAIVVAAHDIGARAKISGADLKVVQYSKDQLPADGFSSPDQVSGFAAVALTANVPVTKSMLAHTPGAATPAAQPVLGIPTGQVAVAIPAGEPLTNVAGFVASGDHVNILVSGLPGQTPGQVATVFSDLTIVVTTGGAVGGRAATGNAWVVYVPAEQAEQLIYLFHNGAYTFVLRSRDDYSKPEGGVKPIGRAEFNQAFDIH
jgi:Flp pilus assembly protein CpaB